MSKKTISCDQAIKEIAEYLKTVDGDCVCEAYSQIMGYEVEYKGDSMIEVDLDS